MSGMRQIQVTLKGITPLLMANGRMANPVEPYAKRLAGLTAAVRKTDAGYEKARWFEFEGHSYYDPEVGYHVPLDAVLSAMAKAAFKVEKAGKEKVQTAVFPPIGADLCPLKAPNYDRTSDTPEKLYERGFKFTTMVKTKSGQRVPVCRPMFRGWTAEVALEFDPMVLNQDTLLAYLAKAGRFVGVGSWRPRYGRFVVEHEGAVVTGDAPEAKPTKKRSKTSAKGDE